MDRALNRRQLLAGASAAALAVALPAIAAPARKGFYTLYEERNPVRLMQRLFEVEGFSIDEESFDSLAAYCEQTVALQRDPDTPPEDLGQYLKAILL